MLLAVVWLFCCSVVGRWPSWVGGNFGSTFPLGPKLALLFCLAESPIRPEECIRIRQNQPKVTQ